MADCEVCGRQALTSAIIEGATLQVCSACLRYGREVTATSLRFVKPVKLAQEIELVPSYGLLIARARDSKHLTREQLAKQLNIKEKDLQHFEEEKVKPTQAEADKLSRYLGITLIVKLDQIASAVPAKRSSSSMPTLGDFIKIKQK